MNSADLTALCRSEWPRLVGSLTRNRIITNRRDIGVAVHPATVGTTLGDEQVALTATVTLTQAVIRSLYFETHAIRISRAIDTVTYETQDSPISNPMTSVQTASVSRLQTALAGH